MKRIISLLIAVLMLCTLCVPAFAAGEVPGEFLDEVLTLANETPRSEFSTRCMTFLINRMANEDLDYLEKIAALIPYLEAAGDHLVLHDQIFCAYKVYYHAYEYAYLLNSTQDPEYTDILLGKLIECAEPAVSQMMEEGEPVMVYNIYSDLGYLYYMCLNDQTTAEKYYTDAVQILLEMAEKAQTDGDLVLAIDMYEKAAGMYNYIFGDEESVAEYQAKADELRAENTASTLSEGSMTIVVGIACLAVGFLVAMLIFKKKKPEESNS